MQPRSSVSRRAIILGAGAVAAWASSPARALLAQAGDGGTASADLDALIAKMTVEEKAGQVTLMAAAWAGGAANALNPTSPSKSSFQQQLADVRRGRVGGVFNGNGAEMARQMQLVATGKSRLKIPLIFAADVIHGFRTVFPMPLAEAGSFDPALAEQTARIAAVEATAAGIDWNFAPMVDIARDQRWGRGIEGAGEDVLLGRIMADARVRGFQGRSGLTADDAMAACAKHFAAYGAAEGGLDYNSVDVSERTLREIYFPSFQAALDAQAATVMASFNELSGVPATANHWLLTDILRRQWKFDGLVVSDYTGDFELIDHGFAADEREAAKLAFLAGVDMSMQSGFYIRHLPDLVKAGDVPVARLDEAVRRVLALKAKLGLFDDPFRRIDPKREKQRVRTPQHLEVARDAARRSIVLLKNEKDLLPLPRSGKRIALIGPFVQGQRELIGPWNVYGTDADAVDLLSGMRAVASDPQSIVAVDGSGIEKPIAGGIEAAVSAAHNADIVILAIGESQKMSGEAQSRTDITIPVAQMALAEAVAQTGKPIVVLLRHGRALALHGAVKEAPAILATWFLGSMSGMAIADILFGVASPSARLPCSFPYESGQEPLYYAHKNTGRPNPPGPRQDYKTHYREAPNAALYPFGHGLTYGEIVYTKLDMGTGRLTAGGELTVVASIRNSGRQAAIEVAQLYVQDITASITRPVRELKAFQRITLKPGETQQVRFTLKRDDLTFLGQDMQPTVEPGKFRLWVAPSAQAEGVSDMFVLA
ncbi:MULTISPECIES: glycoside hydrolase family 3 N-terminal domain-containing protein [Sphingobium]|uniref:beta-glucosidase n=1 Tax=Sphingobium limneticum TaxID=1007511 RepID=A0A5J5IAH9_9SPHN|nr:MULTISPECIES: glycoside hydrolase family 3 N-terminal domain-containing protein [Sphingobium]KAA9020099.1 beta-glucosidase [Sphingobium limneticum]KAA9021421.1 beta-glucosidase [Sphingobium limneticum]KAA9033783.1 beta-glucosidase [Sphingobium limneticum]BBD03248.1 beta-glucosidase [Sphingobium sp. YG1]